MIRPSTYNLTHFQTKSTKNFVNKQFFGKIVSGGVFVSLG